MVAAQTTELEMTKPIIRLSPRAAFLADRIARHEGRNTAEFVSNLIVAYAAGLSFADDPDLDELAAPPAEMPG